MLCASLHALACGNENSNGDTPTGGGSGADSSGDVIPSETETAGGTGTGTGGGSSNGASTASGDTATGGLSGTDSTDSSGASAGTTGADGGTETPSCEQTCSRSIGCPNDEAGRMSCLTICEGYRSICPVEAERTDRCFIALDVSHLGCSDSGLTAIADDSCSEEASALFACVTTTN